MTLAKLLGGLIVSCQAPDDSPLRRTDMMTLMALSAQQGGARGIRAQGIEDVRAIAEAVDLPLIGLFKEPPLDAGRVFITPRSDQAVALARAGAQVIALDGTPRARPGGEALRDIISRIHDETGALVMADIDSIASAEYAARAGADIVGTTLVGYTAETQAQSDGDIDLAILAGIVRAVDLPVLAEGRIWSPAEAEAAMDAGAAGIVVGTAITNPLGITRRFARALGGT